MREPLVERALAYLRSVQGAARVEWPEHDSWDHPLLSDLTDAEVAEVRRRHTEELWGGSGGGTGYDPRR